MVLGNFTPMVRMWQQCPFQKATLGPLSMGGILRAVGHGAVAASQESIFRHLIERLGVPPPTQSTYKQTYLDEMGEGICPTDLGIVNVKFLIHMAFKL